MPKEGDNFTTSCTNFLRANRATKDKDLPDYREQINAITSFLDASFCYGSSLKDLKLLREENSFLLKEGAHGLLPALKSGEGGCVKRAKFRFPMAGDTRVREITQLELNHMVWMREHNRMATELHRINKHWVNDTVFEETRKLITAVLQHITYNHYLPAILGSFTMNKYKLYSRKSEYHDPYSKSINPSVFNGFGTGPYRYGHAQIMADQFLLSPDYATMNVTRTEVNPLDPENDTTGSNIEDFAMWISYIPAMKIDNFAVDGVTKRLFQTIDHTCQDLFARNIQRGRDQGTPAFNRWRKFCGLKPVKFGYFGKYGRILKKLYGSANQIDFFIGGWLETGVNGGVGPTFACVIAKQFSTLKRGDRFWYERPDNKFKFTKAQLNSIKSRASLSKMFCQFFNLDKIEEDIFVKPNNKSALVDCVNLPDINLALWKEGK